MTVNFVVDGVVPVPQGSKRIGRHGTRPVILDDNDAALRLWRGRVAVEFSYAVDADWQPLDEPVEVRAEFYFPRPKSHRYGTWKASAPDIDKLCRALLDGLADGGAYVNDGRVVRLVACKQLVSDLRPLTGATITLSTVAA